MQEEATLVHKRDLARVGVRERPHRAKRRVLLKTIAWWALFLISALFGIYALYMGGLEIAHFLRMAPDAPGRAVPLAFIAHALTGAVALIAGPLQFNRQLLAKRRAVHRWLGRLYVAAIWISSATGLWSALFFGKGPAATILFSLVAILWFGFTTLAYLRARARNFKEHRRWMIRSFALSLFFVTFPLWTEVLAGTPLPQAIGYPLGLFLAFSINSLVAEAWIARRRLPLPAFL